MDYISHIRDYLDADQVVTSRWLAISCRIDVNQSKQILSDFKSNNSSIRATYLISGQLHNKNYSFIVARESTKDEVLAKFSKVSSCEIYSLQRLDSASFASQCQAVDSSQAKEMLNDPSNPDFFLMNEFGRIQLNGLTVKPPGQRSESTVVQKTAAKKESVEEHMTRMFGNRTATSTKSAKTTSVSNFFGDSSSSSSSSSKVKKPIEKVAVETSKQPEKTIVPSEPVAKVVTSKDDDEEEWDDGSSKKVDACKKRKIDDESSDNLHATASTDHNENIRMTNDDSDDEVTEVKSTSKPKKIAAPVHGALDGFMGDVNMTANNDADGKMPGKRTKRQLVEKVSTDEKGYLITEMVYEEVTDDEDEVIAVKAPPPPSKPIAASSAEATKKSTSKKNAPPPANQKSMMSFFKKA